MLGFSPLSTAPVSALETVAPAVRLGQSSYVAAGTAVSGGSVKMRAPAAAFAAAAVAASDGRRLVYARSPLVASAVVSSTPHKRAAGIAGFLAAASASSSPTTLFLEMLTDARLRRRYVVEIHPEFAIARLAS